MRVYLSELFKKIAIRPLLIPAFVLCFLSIIYCSFTMNRNVGLEVGHTVATINITDVTKKVNGKNSYIGLMSKERVSIVTDEELFPGDTVYADGIVEEIHGPANPGEFDYRDYLKKKGILAQFRINEIYEVDESLFGRYITKIRYFLRDEIYSIVSTSVSEIDTSYLAAFCLGDSSLMDDIVSRNFRVVNCSHILAVSGSHFSAFILILPFIFQIFNLSGKKSGLIFIIAILVIGFMTGWTESVTRAAIMSVCSIFMRDSLSGMSFAAIIMILSNPFAIMSSGFQMSFCASISIIALNSRVKKVVKNYVHKKEISDSIAVAICSQAGLLLFSLTNSPRIGIINFLTQIVGGFLIEFICVFFVFGIITNIFISSSFEPASIVARILIRIIDFSSGFIEYSLNLRDFGIIPICCLFICVLVMLKKISLFKKIYKFLVLMLVSIVIVSTISILWNKPKVKVIFIDVGQGDSCLILTDRYSCLVDSGIDVNGAKVIPDVLDYYSIDKVDFAIMTHWDMDHGGGMIELLKCGRINEIYTSFVGVNDNVSQMLEAFYQADTIPEIVEACFRELHYGQNIQLDSNTNLKVIWPFNKATEGDNADSLVMRLDAFDTSILLTGDIDTMCEDSLCDLGLVEKTDILKVAHHGSRYSSGEIFLKTITPDNAIISVGEGNFYGHPAVETLDRLEKVKANTYQTSKNGAIIVNIFTAHYEISTFKENKDAF